MKRYPWLLPVILTVICLLAIRLKERYFSPSLKVTFFDVGQGDSILVRFPYGRTLLIDAGGGWKNGGMGKWVLFPQLSSMGILHLDYALLTHPDRDHLYGFFSLMDDISIGEFWLNGSFVEQSIKPPLLSLLLEKIDKKRISVKGWKVPKHRTLNGVKLTLLPPNVSTQKHNDRSLNLLSEFAGCTFLFTGDIEGAAESSLLPNLGPITFLKVAHHGSRTSSTESFLTKTRPRAGIISNGYLNRFSHPHGSTLQKLRNHNITIFRTDFHGYVEISVSPHGNFHCRHAHGVCGTGRC